MNKLTLSVALITLDEERIIGKTLDAVKDVADEIIVVDSGSTDDTIELAESRGAKVFNEAWKGFSDQKNSAMAKCEGEWILSLDADEVIPQPLANEIRQVINGSGNANSGGNGDVLGYKIAREFYIGDRRIRHGGYFPDYQLRLVRNGIGAKFGKRSVHESISMDGNISHLKNPLKHYAYEDFADYKIALDKYAKLAREEIRVKKLRLPWVRASWAFAFRYFARLGFLEGKLGLKMAIAYAGYVREKYELNR